MQKKFVVLLAAIVMPAIILITILMTKGSMDSHNHFLTLLYLFMLGPMAILALIFNSAFRKPALSTTKWNRPLPWWTPVLVLLLLVVAYLVVLQLFVYS